MNKEAIIKNNNNITIVGIEQTKYKSKLIIGDNSFVINHTKHFNWFRKIMYKIVFDIKIEDIGDNNE